MNRIRIALCVLALAGAAPALHAQCTWELERPTRGRAAVDDSVSRAVNAASRGAIVRAAAAAGVAEPRGLVIFTVDESGRDPFVRVFDGNVPDDVLQGLVPEMTGWAKQLRQRAPGRRGLHTRLDTLPLPPVRADGKRRECRPELTNRDHIRAGLERWVVQHSGDRGPRSGAAMLTAFVDRDGRVRHAELARRSGNESFDRFALQLASQLAFRGATLDGVPRDVWVQLPLQFQL
jgi:TonB family protein